MLSQSESKYIRSLHKKKHQKENKKFVVEGVRICKEAAQSDFTIESVFYHHP